MDELRAAIEEGTRILLADNLDPNTKRKRLLTFLENAQLKVDARLEAAIRMSHEVDEDSNPSK